MTKLSDFSVFDVNHADRIVVLEDKELSLYIEIPFGNKELVAVRIVEPYAIY